MASKKVFIGCVCSQACRVGSSWILRLTAAAGFKRQVGIEPDDDWSRCWSDDGVIYERSENEAASYQCCNVLRTSCSASWFGPPPWHEPEFIARFVPCQQEEQPKQFQAPLRWCFDALLLWIIIWKWTGKLSPLPELLFHKLGYLAMGFVNGKQRTFAFLANEKTMWRKSWPDIFAEWLWLIETKAVLTQHIYADLQLKPHSSSPAILLWTQQT